MTLSCNIFVLHSVGAFERFFEALSAEQLRDVTNVAMPGHLVATWDSCNGWKDSVPYPHTMFPGLKRIFIVREAVSRGSPAGPIPGCDWETERLEAEAKRIFGIGQERDDDCKIVTLGARVQ